MADVLTEQLDTAISSLKNERDVRFARSLRDQHAAALASGTKPLSANQLYWAKTMIERSGQKAASTTFDKVEEDIFGTTAPRKPQPLCDVASTLLRQGKYIDAIREQHERRGKMTLAEAKQDVDFAKSLMVNGQDPTIEGSTQPVPTTAPKQVIEIAAEELEQRLSNIVTPLVTDAMAQVEASAEARQEAFNKNAAKSIAQAVVVEAIKRLDARVPRQVNITVTRPDNTTHNVSGAVHCQFERLLRAASTRLPNGYAPGIFLQGEASSGKTMGTKKLAEVLGFSWHFNGAISFPHEMLGFIDGNGNYHRTPFRDAYEHGGVYTFDEVDRSDPVALLAVNPHLAGEVATFPDTQIKRHADCILTATANTWGLGADANYSGATKLDAAFLSRFPVRINWDIDPLLEDQIVSHHEWLQRIRDARSKARSAGLKVLIDTRTAQAGVALIQSGYSMDEAASMTYLANLKPEQKVMLS